MLYKTLHKKLLFPTVGLACYRYQAESRYGTAFGMVEQSLCKENGTGTEAKPKALKTNLSSSF